MTYRIPTMEEVEEMVRRCDELRAFYARQADVIQKAREKWLSSEEYSEMMRQQEAADRRLKQLDADNRRAAARNDNVVWLRPSAAIAKAVATLKAKPERTEQETARDRRSRQRWADLIDDPMTVMRQVAWEKDTTALRMREAGMTWQEVGDNIGVSRERARQKAAKALRWRMQKWRKSPAEHYLNNLNNPVMATMSKLRCRLLAETIEPLVTADDDWLLIREAM
jgi:DNA-directed RNA polymerase sigma subunit (sigma70/sigma32)